MADRIVRDELLESERFARLLAKACAVDPKMHPNTPRVCYLALLLRADAFGNFSAQPYRLWKVWRDFDVADESDVAPVLAKLEAVDLIRLYEVDGVPLLHIPRYRQSLRYAKKRVFAVSPWDEFPLKQEPSAKPQGAHSERTGSAPPKRSEVKRSELKPRARKAGSGGAVDNSAPTAGNGNGAGDSRRRSTATARPGVSVSVLALEALAKAHRLTARAGETPDAFRARVYAARDANKRKH